jgi:DNA invertase Pin-like site-specific DNA recombinase/transcription elongation factor Elf1
MNKVINHVAMYLRISQEKKNENVETLTNHRQLLTEYCKSNGYTYEEFGEVISGGKTELEDRIQLQRLLNNIEKFDAILCVELSRLSRNGLISQTVKQYCVDYDKPILTPYQIYDLANSDTDRLMFDVGSMISSHEHGIIGKRSKTNKIQMSKQGLHVSGNVPFGYVRNSKTKKLEIDEKTAETIRYIFQLHSKGMGSFKIRDILNEEGYKSATGKVFNLPSVKRIIQNPHYKGWTVFQDRKRIKKQGKVTYEVIDTIVVKDTHPAIIPPKEWDQANRDRVERAEKFGMYREKPVTKSKITMLKDLLYCQVCGKKMSIRKDNKSAVGYTLKKCEYLQYDGNKCPNCGVKIEFIEKEVINELDRFKERLISYLKLIQEKGSSQLKQENQHKLTQINKRLKDVTDQENKLLDLALSGLFTNDQIKAKQQELIDLKSRLETERDLLMDEEESPKIEDVSERVQLIVDNIDNLQNLNPEQTNETLKTFVKKIHYKRVIPEDLLHLSTRNPQRKFYPFELKFEYYEV